MFSKKTFFYVWDTYSDIIGILTINKFWQLGYRELGLYHILVSSLSIFEMVANDNCWHVVWVVIEALLIIRVVHSGVLPCRFLRFCGGHTSYYYNYINTFGCLSSSHINSCYSLSKMTFSTPEMTILKIAIWVKESKCFAFEFFPLSDKGFSSSKFGFAMAFWSFHHIWKRLSFWYFIPQSLIKNYTCWRSIQKTILKTNKDHFMQVSNVRNHFWSQSNLNLNSFRMVWRLWNKINYSRKE